MSEWPYSALEELEISAQMFLGGHSPAGASVLALVEKLEIFADTLGAAERATISRRLLALAAGFPSGREYYRVLDRLENVASLLRAGA